MYKKSNNLKLNQQEKLEALIQNDKYKFWLGGFVEGEGTLVISAVSSPKVSHGITLQPEFNVAQHESGRVILESFKHLFNGAGGVNKKSGSNKVLVYSLKGTSNLIAHIVPFYENYVLSFSNKYKVSLFEDFKYVLGTIEKHKYTRLTKSDLISMVKLIYKMNPDGKGKQRKRTLDEVIHIIENNNK